MRIRKEFPRIDFDLRSEEGQDFTRQRRAREDGTGREAKESAL